MARYLVTGVAGFIGSWLARELVEQGHSVRGIDNLSSGDLHNLEGVERDIDVRVADLRDPDAVRRACEGVDYVFHEAAIASVFRSIQDPLGTLEVNLEGTIRLIMAAEKAGVQRLVFASSSSVYGDRGDMALNEESCPRPLSPYAMQKLSCEYSLQASTALTGMETVSLRYFNVFGPRQSSCSPYSGVIAKFIDQMSRCEVPTTGVTIFGDGEQSRDFIYISDVVRANMLAMHAPSSLVSGRTFNIGTGIATSVNRLFKSAAWLCGFDQAPYYQPARNGEIRQSVACVEAARTALGFGAGICVDEGLERLVHWNRQRELRPEFARSDVGLVRV